MNERTYRQLHPRVIDATPRSRLRDGLFIALVAALALLFWCAVMIVVFVLDTGPVILR